MSVQAAGHVVGLFKLSQVSVDIFSQVVFDINVLPVDISSSLSRHLPRGMQLFDGDRVNQVSFLFVVVINVHGYICVQNVLLNILLRIHNCGLCLWSNGTHLLLFLEVLGWAFNSERWLPLEATNVFCIVIHEHTLLVGPRGR